jgi:hypothetical protein
MLLSSKLFLLWFATFNPNSHLQKHNSFSNKTFWVIWMLIIQIDEWIQILFMNEKGPKISNTSTEYLHVNCIRNYSKCAKNRLECKSA